MKNVCEMFTVIRIQDQLVESFETFSHYDKAIKYFVNLSKRYYKLPEDRLYHYAKKRILMDKNGNSIQLISHGCR